MAKTKPTAKPITGKEAGSYYSASGVRICYQAYCALYAVAIRQQVGRYMVRKYLEKRGIPFSLYRLACQLQATDYEKS